MYINKFKILKKKNAPKILQIQGFQRVFLNLLFLNKKVHKE